VFAGGDEAALYTTWGTPLFILNQTADKYGGAPWFFPGIKGENHTQVTQNGPWTKLSTIGGLYNVTVSLCYTAWATSRMDVNMVCGDTTVTAICLDIC
jgi:hypothetical protein